MASGGSSPVRVDESDLAYLYYRETGEVRDLRRMKEKDVGVIIRNLIKAREYHSREYAQGFEPPVHRLEFARQEVDRARRNLMSYQRFCRLGAAEEPTNLQDMIDDYRRWAATGTVPTERSPNFHDANETLGGDHAKTPRRLTAPSRGASLMSTVTPNPLALFLQKARPRSTPPFPSGVIEEYSEQHDRVEEGREIFSPLVNGNLGAVPRDPRLHRQGQDQKGHANQDERAILPETF
jgi:hypothetical protein